MIQGNNWKVFQGSNLDVLPTLEDNSIDSIVTDPPYELGFMGKKWDSSGIAYNVELWRECLRVLKPGGHLLSFGGSRTWHRIAVAIEDAGFEVRDSIAWMYGSGFPKSLDISKAIDKAAGAEREVIGSRPLTGNGKTMKSGFHQPDGSGAGATIKEDVFEFTAPATAEAKQWEGWGTALKPAFEPIIVARKPLIGTVAENVLTYGTGGLNIDGSRIPSADVIPQMSGAAVLGGSSDGWDRPWKNDPEAVKAREQRAKEAIEKANTLGRWPANVILDPYTAELLDEQSGITKSGKSGLRTSDGFNANAYGKGMGIKAGQDNGEYGDTGGASRFFYVAKASKRDRNEGLEELEEKQATEMTGRQDGSAGLLRVRADGSIGENPYAGKSGAAKNFHPTVKPTDLMRYLIKLVTPPGGVVLDPFTGSGSTGKAAILEGFDFIGIELTEEYLPIIEGRLKWAKEQRNLAEAKKDEALF